ncbi:MarR family transcriptional regulator [Kibdelosporangium philippinense]|uniref:MarR family transcriptional regulator n=1 Tax=Kibdelosporangium philippinense TaxID=211113 RepID=A0ABS8ZBZ4_9PSEU|nr:MarR family transcriptional regulator [Kibdelosporangium philippinense]MCE7005386.1 MarR family transcriptional regulator [Kibdelosporangium philippinense]
MSREEAWGRLVALHARIEGELGKALQRRHGLGLSEYRALDHLSRATGKNNSLRIQELAEALELNQSSVSRLVARLESAGLSERDICEDDRRGIYTMLTETGRKSFEDAEPTYQQTLEQALEKAEADPQLKAAVSAFRTLS